MLIIKGLLGGLIQLALLAAILIVPAGLVPGGTWYWERALIFIVVYGIIVEATIVTFAVKAPASLQSRLAKPSSRNQPFADRIITAMLGLTLLAWLVFIPVDVFYLKLLPTPHLAISVAGWVLLLFGYAIVMAAIYQNSFIVPVVADLTEQGQTVVDTGPYGVVRHPLYAGLVPLFAGIALWLQSYASLVAMVVPLAVVVARVLVEESSLQKTLPGYTEYIKRVRYRLAPFIW